MKNSYFSFLYEKYEFFIFVYFLLGLNYIEKSNLNLSENQLLALILRFFQSNNTNKIRRRTFKIRKTKEIKLKTENEQKKGKNIIRLNLEEIFGNDSPNKNSLVFMELKTVEKIGEKIVNSIILFKKLYLKL